MGELKRGNQIDLTCLDKLGDRSEPFEMKLKDLKVVNRSEMFERS